MEGGKDGRHRELKASLGDIPLVTDRTKVQLKSRDFYWYSPVLKRQLESVCADLVVEPRDEAEVIRALRACHRAARAGHRARRRHRQLRPGDALAGRRGPRPLAARQGPGDRARPGARRGRRQARPDRPALPDGFGPGAALSPEHAEDGHDRRLRRRRLERRRLDHLGHPARSRQHPGPAGHHHGGRAARDRAARRCDPEGQPRLRHQRRDHRGRDAAGAGLPLGRPDRGLRRPHGALPASPMRSPARTASSRS